MKKRSKFVSFVFGLFRFVLVCMLILSIFASVISVFFNHTLLNKQFYKTQLTSDIYINEIYEYVKKSVKSSSLYYGLPYDEIIEVVTKDSVRALSDKYCDAMYESLTSGSKMAPVVYSSDSIYKVLDDYFVRENFDVTKETTRLIADDISAVISSNIVAVRDSYGNTNIFKPLSKYIFANKICIALAKYSVAIIIACAVLTVLSLVFSASSFKARLYNVANAFWLSGCIMYIPILFFKKHDIFSKIIISESPVNPFIDIIGVSIIDKLLSITSVVFIISCIILSMSLVTYIVSLVLKYKNKHKQTITAAEDADKTDAETDV